MSWFNFIDDNEKYQLYAEGKLCLTCCHKAHCGQSCIPCEDGEYECDCFECGCINCQETEKQRIGPTDV